MAAFFVRREPAWSHMTVAPDGLVQSHMRKLAHRIERLAIRQAGKDTGELRAKMSVEMLRSASGPAWRIGSSARHAHMHHRGTRPHLIQPRRARMLRFKSRGRIVYARLVMHPGTKPNRYLTDNLRRVIR